ncbi:heavy metal sensor histidine kinase [Buttiauxella sp. B2]|uniref:Cu(+)/Ag(+) sensor histidine kinase n=1 Tax=Buttiauxella sp. B2 TaxID=2587812 RepID=UPI00112015C6|nr:Cu(+)/Ag(+) sensor histidine kinase [Buttiauxella sp. B2]TNV16840.1 heavy metal sensor histidine kinase [Buttiauxella sp. B2]
MRINGNRRPFSLATRLTVFISLSTIIAFVAFTWVMLHSVEQHFAERDLSDLQQVSTTLENILKDPNKTEQQKIETIGNVMATYHNFAVLLLNGNNQVLYHSPDGPNLTLALPSVHFTPQSDAGNYFIWSDSMKSSDMHSDGEMKNMAYRIITRTVNISESTKPVSYSLLIAFSIDFHQHYIDQLKRNLISIASAISLMIILIILFAVYKGHQPLRNVSMKIKNISSENLDVRLDPSQVPIELEQLVISFNHMIERIEDVFTRQANFSADIAHEIRTPITNLVTQTEILLSQDRTDEELKDVLYSNLEEYSRMAKMTSDMLFLAQADNNQLIPERTMIDLRDETTKVFEFFEAWAEEREVSLKFEGNHSRVEGDPLMLRRVINNLLSNAIRYTPKKMAVTVRVIERQEWVDLIVENPGTPIPEEHLPMLFDRFYRVDPSRQRKIEGSGIGLAIVKSIVSAHKGKISIASDIVSTRFIISLPVSSR